MAVYAIDTEFLQSGNQKIDLVSIGIASSDGREYYAESLDFDPADANDWVQVNVLPKLGPVGKRKTRALIAEEIQEFIGDDPAPIFLAYYCAYDWVCFVELFGSFGEMPKAWPKLCWDLKCLVLQVGAKDIPPDPINAHNALDDARWNIEVLNHLVSNYGFKFPVGDGSQGAPSEAPPADEPPAAMEDASGVWGLFGQIKREVLKQSISEHLVPVGAKGRFFFEALGDNVVDNLMDDLKRATSVELAQFVVGLLNMNMPGFAFAYTAPQHDSFHAALKAVVERYRLMDGSEQGDLFVKVQLMFKDLFISRYADLGPEAAEEAAMNYAGQMIEFLKDQAIQAADLSVNHSGKFY